MSENERQASGTETDLDDFRLEIPHAPTTSRLASAFIYGLIFNYAQDSARSWAAPYKLEKRIGSIEASALAVMHDTIVERIATRPALHRFPRVVGRSITAAASLILTEFDGDPRRIWAAPLSIEEMQDRFERLPGIGAHKAMMACYLLGVFRLVEPDEKLIKKIRLECPKLYEVSHYLLPSEIRELD
ncbi:hypothetical protein GR247_39040 [Rhizobium leguminosarum]|nr:hypothetical protein [Rhizobium leguminosarum]